MLDAIIPDSITVYDYCYRDIERAGHSDGCLKIVQPEWGRLGNKKSNVGPVERGNRRTSGSWWGVDDCQALRVDLLLQWVEYGRCHCLADVE